MIKYAFALTIVCLVAACGEPSKVNTAAGYRSDTLAVAKNPDNRPAPQNLMIDPGVGIGQIKIGTSTDRQENFR